MAFAAPGTRLTTLPHDRHGTTREARVAGERPLRLLLVEDDIDVAAGIGDYLGAHGVMVDFACTAAQARARLQAQAFELVVLDVNLPDQDGLSLCRDLKREGGLRSPVLFLTARAALDDKLSAFAAGAMDYMVKPFAPAELLARARTIAAHVPASGGAQVCVGAWVLDLHGRLLRRGGASLPLHASGFAFRPAATRCACTSINCGRPCSSVSAHRP